MLKIASHITISTETKILHTVSGMGGAAQCQEWVVLHIVRNGWCCTVSGMGGAAQCQEWVVLHTAQCQEWVVLHSVRNGWCCTVSGMGGAAQCQEWVVLHSVRNGWCCTVSGMGGAALVAVVLNAGKVTQINDFFFFLKDKEKVLCG